ncbi:MAG: tagatose 1,6-diphosphate aldolase [Geminicoccaceae bacterium]
MTALSAGKLRSMRRLADANGFFTMLAVDQRVPIMGPIEAAHGRVVDAEVTAVKRALLATLAPAASAVLCDPMWAYPFSHDLVAPGQGLVVTLEDHRFEDGPGGRRTRTIPGWSVEKIKRMGGDGVKVLAYYRPDAAREVLAHQQAFVRAVGAACRRFDIPFVLELLVHPLAGTTDDPIGDPATRAELVLESVRTFAAPEFGVDLFKLESPIPSAQLPDPDAAEADGVRALFDRLDKAAGRPWVVLSAGATAADFQRALTYALPAGASGFLAGRAIWSQAFQHYPDLEAMAAALRGDSLPYLRALGDLTARLGHPWRSPPMADAGLDFPRRYGDME